MDAFCLAAVLLAKNFGVIPIETENELDACRYLALFRR